MRKHVRTFQHYAILVLFLLHPASFHAESIQAVSETVSSEEMDRQIAAGKRHDFIVTADGAVIDSAGTKILVRDLKKSLKKGKYDRNAFYVLWVEASSIPMETRLTPIVEVLASYGVEKVALKRKPVSTQIASDLNSLATPVDPPGSGKKVMVLKGQPNPKSITAADAFPSMEDRPLELRPQKLPRRVRYKFAPDAQVIAAAKTAAQHFLSENSPSETIFGNAVVVSPGAWTHFCNESDIGKKEAKPITANTEFNGRTRQLNGIFLQNASEIASLENALRNLVRKRGGGTVRALKTNEMEKWWTFIALDIEEPVLVLETNDRAFAFILSFTDHGVLVLDELNALPDL